MSNTLKGYDANQVLRSVFDVDKNTLRVSIVEGSSGGGSFEVVISHVNDSIRLGDGSNFFTSTYIGPKVGLDVGVVNEVNIEDLDAAKDNVAIHDTAGDELNVNPDGSINVQSTVNSNASGLKVYNEVSAIASGIETIVATHTALAGRRTFLQKVSASGDNIAKYKVKVNGTTVDFRRTNFGSDLNANFFFDGELNPGLAVGVGAVITVTVLHNRGSVSDFNAKIQYLEVL